MEGLQNHEYAPTTSKIEFYVSGHKSLPINEFIYRYIYRRFVPVREVLEEQDPRVIIGYITEWDEGAITESDDDDEHSIHEQAEIVTRKCTVALQIDYDKDLCDFSHPEKIELVGVGVGV